MNSIITSGLVADRKVGFLVENYYQDITWTHNQLEKFDIIWKPSSIISL